jgi:hypothetical protein
MNYKVCGMREEIYIGQEVSGHNCDFDYVDAEMTRHVLLLKSLEDGTKVELTLQEDQGECCSGWCTASYGNFEWNVVEEFAGKTHTYSGSPVEVNESLLNTLEDSFDCEAFIFSEYGGCCYYPSGNYSINLPLFTPI